VTVTETNVMTVTAAERQQKTWTLGDFINASTAMIIFLEAANDNMHLADMCA